jgi:peptidoglycan/LPS O-acetylase OafA/YrhL
MVHALNHFVSVPLLALLSIVVSLAASEVFYRWVEKPSIAAGRSFGERRPDHSKTALTTA